MARRALLLLSILLIGVSPLIVLLLLNLIIDTRQGDYHFEVDPAIISAIKGSFFSFYDSDFSPAMFPASIIVRGIVVSAASNIFSLGIKNDLGSITTRYIIGSISIYLISSVILIYALKDKLKSTTALALFTLSVCISPVALSAVFWGHPEEFMMSSAVLSAAILAINRKYFISAVFLGIALATKQPAWLAVAPILLFVPKGERIKYLLISIIATLLMTVPFLIEGFHSFFNHNFISASSQDFGMIRGSNIFSLFKMEGLAASGKFIVLFLSVLVPVTLCKLNKKQGKQQSPQTDSNQFRLNLNQLIIVLFFVFFLRSVLDVANVTYYALPAALILYLFDYYYQFDNTSSKKLMRWFTIKTCFPKIAYVGSVTIAMLLLGFSELIEIPKTLASFIVGVPSIIIIVFTVKTLYKPYNKYIKPIHIAIVLLMFLSMIIPQAWYKLNEKPIYTSLGMRNVSMDRIRTGFRGRHAAWLGGESIKSSKGKEYYLKQHSMREDLFSSGKIIAKKDRYALDIIYIMDYGVNNNIYKTISIYSSYQVKKKSREIYNDCIYRNKCRSSGITWRTIETPLGKGMYFDSENGNAWKVKIIYNKQMVYIINDDADFSADEVLSKLEILK